jgi:hypothetical protein
LEQKKNAYEILGVNKDASKNEIERRYTILLKKHRLENSKNSDDKEFDEITEAYNLLMGYSTELPVERKNKKPNPVLKKLGINEEKAANFLHYYKHHIIISIIVLVVLITSVKSCVTRVPPDFNIAFIGNYLYTDTEPLRENILDNWPEIKEISIDGAMISGNSESEVGYAMQMKAAVLFGGGDIDVFILDKYNFERYAKQEAFISLDQLVEELGIDMEKNKEYILKAETEESDGKEYLYGVDVSGSKMFEGTGIKGDEKIAAIFVGTKRYDLAVKFLDILLESS